MKNIYLFVGLASLILITGFVPEIDPIIALRDEMIKRDTKLEKDINNLKATLNSKEENFDRSIYLLNKQISGLKADVKYNTLPVGSIVAFGLDERSIPTGWVLCDGRAVTDQTSVYKGYNVPDLRSHFIRGKGSNESLLTESGTNNHSHSMPGHKHEVGSHTHHFTTDYSSIPHAGSCDYGIACRAAPGQMQYLLFGSSASEFEQRTSHSHSGTTSNASNGYTASGGSGYTASESNIPNYIALNYIIKIK